MPKHNVHVNLPWHELGKSDVQFKVFQNDEMLGRITISKGALEWYPKNAKKPLKIGWSHFDKMVREYFQS